MRRFLKKEILDVLKTLREAIVQIVELRKLGEVSRLQTILTDCQEAAISVGNAIDESEGEGTEAVIELSKYCELLYQIFVGDSCEKFELEQSLTKVTELVEALPEKMEVVFLPYKASMWDSLESVWLAARNDEQCETYVIPIPYYDKSSNGSFREEHYEGDLFPEYVPITRYDSYNFAKRKPDIIFIHNPYDQYNYVTSVHPYFYSKNIKKYTDKLIYIPYFIHQNDVVKCEYCLVPGVLYSDMVILQSEKVKERYREIYEQEMGLSSSEKFQALGSPKLDASVCNEEVPKLWKMLIYQNHVRRKVILLNTHLVCLMNQYAEDFFAKIEEVFSVFRHNNEVVLLWRPHPLSLATANAMNPEASKRYLALIEWYKKENFGIYDDSADIHRAVNVSDAYYGNKSSVTEMFRNQGKPIMIMNLKLHE